MPTKTKRSSIFLATYIGIALPTILVQAFGAALYTGAQRDPTWKHAYARYGVGGPLAMALEPAGRFGKFLMVLAALSSIPVSISQPAFSRPPRLTIRAIEQRPEQLFFRIARPELWAVGCTRASNRVRDHWLCGSDNRWMSGDIVFPELIADALVSHRLLDGHPHRSRRGRARHFQTLSVESVRSGRLGQAENATVRVGSHRRIRIWFLGRCARYEGALVRCADCKPDWAWC